MKKIVYLVFLSSILSSNVKGQIFSEAIYNSNPQLEHFNHMTSKWMVVNGNNIYLYNLNHSLYTQIVVPPQPYIFGVQYVTDDLFDTDSTNLEYMINAAGTGFGKFVKIYKANGTLLFVRDSAALYAEPIVVTDSGTKLRLQIMNSPSYFQLYSLPGTLPCPMICGGSTVPGEIPTMIQENYKDFSNPYPNPSNQQTHIPYQLPVGETTGEIIFYDLTGSEVKRYKVDKTFSELILTASDLAAGSYYYQLQTPYSKSEGKKLVVIK